MKRLLTVLSLSLFTVVYSFCDNKLTAPDEEIPAPGYEGSKVPLNDVVAVTVRFNPPYAGGSTISKLVLLDYNNPTRYKIVGDLYMFAEYPRFSPDKSKILYVDRGKGSRHDPAFLLYDVQNDSIKVLDSPMHPMGHLPLWKYDCSGFYYTNSYFAGTMFFRFSTKIREWISSEKGYIYYPLDIKGTDTLIVNGKNTEGDEKIRGVYFTDHEGSCLTLINNPYLETSKIFGKFLRWSNDLGLIVYVENDTTLGGTKISVTNSDGSYYRCYTSGEFNDTSPVWGPESKTILFERGRIIYIIDIETGDISEFATSYFIYGAHGLSYPDY
ncbi:hypothetical protein AMJ80_05005 [bacterium SM23_31]|nr:MAG: hypothetical protein AMJ80_05005 [bacterium SM23_31]